MKSQTNLSLRKLHIRGAIIATVEALIIALSGIFLAKGQLLITFIVVEFAIAMLHKERTLEDKSVDLYLWLLTILTCLTASFLSGIWHTALCGLLVKLGSTQFSCELRHMQATVWASLFIPGVWILITVFTQLFLKNKK